MATQFVIPASEARRESFPQKDSRCESSLRVATTGQAGMTHHAQAYHNTYELISKSGGRSDVSIP